MDHVAILGSNGLLGQHLVRELQYSNPTIDIRLWNYSDGLDSLDEVINDSNVVFNLHEYQDFSIAPDWKKLNNFNIEFVQKLLNKCESIELSNAPALIHLSSTYLQCSSWWPNVNGRENDHYEKFRKGIPFSAYCESKHKAEELIRHSSLNSILARVGPLYGEDDHCSLICDAIFCSKSIGFLPVIGDENGVLQFSYAGNAANALLKCAENRLSQSQNKLTPKKGDTEEISYDFDADFQSGNNLPKLHKSEIVLIMDHTPLKSVYDLVSKVANNCERNLSEEKTKNTDGKESICFSKWRIPFYLFFILYFFISIVGWFLGRFLRVNSILNRFPSPYYLYLVLHHWTFFSGFKLRILFDFLPKYDTVTSIQRSYAYYQHLKPDQIHSFSWINPS